MLAKVPLSAIILGLATIVNAIPVPPVARSSAMLVPRVGESFTSPIAEGVKPSSNVVAVGDSFGAPGEAEAAPAPVVETSSGV